MDTGLQIALKHFKSRHAMAIALNAWRSAVYTWKRIPPQHCMRAAELIGVNPADLRPDVFEAVTDANEPQGAQNATA